MFILLLLSAFEFAGHSGAASSMLAGAAVPDAEHSFHLNPALIVTGRRFQAGSAYCSPYGLPGLTWGRITGVWHAGPISTGLAFSSLGIDRYAEQDAQFVVGGAPIPSVAVGLGVHALIITNGPQRDLAPAIDAGACWQSSRVRLGASGLRLNSPRWRDGEDLPPRFTIAGSWRPVDELLLALDLSRERSDEDAVFGAEFRLVPQFGLRLGVGAAPLRYAAGIGADVGPIGFEYAYQFHPVLKETHVFGLRAAWR